MIYQFDAVLHEWRPVAKDQPEVRVADMARPPSYPQPRPQFSYSMEKEKISIRLNKVRQEQSFTIYFENFTPSRQLNSLRANNADGHSLMPFDMQAFAGVTWLV